MYSIFFIAFLSHSYFAIVFIFSNLNTFRFSLFDYVMHNLNAHPITKEIFFTNGPLVYPDIARCLHIPQYTNAVHFVPQYIYSFNLTLNDQSITKCVLLSVIIMY